MKKIQSLMNLLALATVLFCSCAKDPVTDPTPKPVDTTRTPSPVLPQPTFDSVWVLDYARNSTFAQTTYFQYDTVHKRYKGWSQTYSWFDSTFILYNNDGTVRSLVRKKSETPAFRVTASVFTYNSQKQIEKIYHKMFKDADREGRFDDSYYTTLPMQDFHNDYTGYDSVIYNSQNRIGAIYNKQLVDRGLPFETFQSLLLEYPAGDSLISKATIRQHSSDNTIESSRDLHFIYNQYKNPYYKLARQLCFLGGLNVFTDISLVPVFTDARDANKLLSVSPYLCASLNFNPPYQYRYRPDSLPVKAAPNTDFVEGVDFFYKKVRQ